MHPIILSLGPFTFLGLELPVITIYSYGVMMALGFLCAATVTGRLLARRGMDPELAWSIVVWAAVGGLIGARIVSILDAWEGFIAAPITVLFSGAGFVWYGGLLGGLVSVSLLIFLHRLDWLAVVDCASPGLALGQAIGRVGCQLAGDGDWGKPSSLPWAMSYPNSINDYWSNWVAASGLPPTVKVHPTPVYESLAYLLAFILLIRLSRKNKVNGSVFWCYLVTVGGARFVIEYFRINPAWLFGYTQAQVVSVILVSIGLAGLLRPGLPFVRRAT